MEEKTWMHITTNEGENIKIPDSKQMKCSGEGR